ncbi:MAG: hypothetical protein IPK19_01190 [Chloroflexi bacterium]|nr:hypothetical protein [Chloroflexota bacterium]
MEKSITTALFIVVSMILALMLFNVAYPAVTEGGDAVVSMANDVAERMRYDIEIIHASAELDDSGWWQDFNGNGQFDVNVWVKNIGDERIIGLDRVDVFFGREGNFARIAYVDEASGSYPNWTATVENGADWNPTGTLRITIRYQAPLTRGRYFVKVILPNGISSEYFLGI